MRRWTNLALIAATIGVLTGCGSSSNSSSSAAASKASFCADNAKLDQRTNSASNVGELLKVLKSNQGTIKDFGQNAPSAIKAQAEVLVSAADKGIKSGSTTGFNQKFAAAGKAVDSYCAKK